MRDLAALVDALRAHGLTVAVAESLTGGLVVADLVAVPGVSSILHGGVVAYATPLKRDVIGVDADLLDEHGAVHPEVARQLAERVRHALAVDGRDARVGIGTTGVAGPDPQDGVPPGTAYVAVAIDDRTEIRGIDVTGDRAAVRAAAVSAAFDLLGEMLGAL